MTCSASCGPRWVNSIRWAGSAGLVRSSCATTSTASWSRTGAGLRGRAEPGGVAGGYNAAPRPGEAHGRGQEDRRKARRDPSQEGRGSGFHEDACEGICPAATAAPAKKVAARLAPAPAKAAAAKQAVKGDRGSRSRRCSAAKAPAGRRRRRNPPRRRWCQPRPRHGGGSSPRRPRARRPPKAAPRKSASPSPSRRSRSQARSQEGGGRRPLPRSRSRRPLREGGGQAGAEEARAQEGADAAAAAVSLHRRRQGGLPAPRGGGDHPQGAGGCSRGSAPTTSSSRWPPTS